jgi:hypothetical protein
MLHRTSRCRWLPATRTTITNPSRLRAREALIPLRFRPLASAGKVAVRRVRRVRVARREERSRMELRPRALRAPRRNRLRRISILSTWLSLRVISKTFLHSRRDVDSNLNLRQPLKALAQPAAAEPANVHPPKHHGVFTWAQIEVIRKINPELASFDHFSHEHPGGQ